MLVGIAAGRAYLPRNASSRMLVVAMTAFAALSMLPDADVVAFAFGIPYEDALGHRGWTHSFAFAGLCAIVLAAIAPALDQPRRRLALFGLVVVASHAVLDTTTDGGLGCALFWPFTAERYFAPVTPLPVAPIGRYMLSGRGLYVMLFEFVVFLPFFVYATYPRRRAT